MESVDDNVADGMRVWTGYGREGKVLIQLEGLVNNTSSSHQCLEKGKPELFKKPKTKHIY